MWTFSKKEPKPLKKLQRIFIKNGDRRAAVDALENRMEEVTQRFEDKIDKLESF